MAVRNFNDAEKQKLIQIISQGSQAQIAATSWPFQSNNESIHAPKNTHTPKPSDVGEMYSQTNNTPTSDVGQPHAQNTHTHTPQLQTWGNHTLKTHTHSNLGRGITTHSKHTHLKLRRLWDNHTLKTHTHTPTSDVGQP